MTAVVLFLKAQHVKGHVRGARYISPYERSGRSGQPIMSYRSGASAPNIIRGYIGSNTPLGVSLAELTHRGPAWDMMVGYAQRGGEVFVDSGAFSAFTQGHKMDWAKVAQTYRDLIHDAPGARMHIVMPDVVGDQAASLRLLAEHVGLVHEVMAAGHDPLVPVQKGELRPYDAWRAAVDTIGSDDFTVSIPSNAAAFSPADLANLMDGPHKPARIHLLGVAGNRKKLGELVRVIHSRSPATRITSDAVLLRAQVGQGRPVTEERAKAAAWLKDAFASLLDDPEKRALFLAHADEIIRPAVAAMSIAAVENRARDQRQGTLFGDANA